MYDVVKRGLQSDPADRWPDMAALLAALKPRASVPRRRLLIATLATALLVAAWAGWTQQRLQVCAGFEQRLVGVWDAPKKKELHQAILSTGVPWADSAWKGVERSLDAWTQEWLRASRTACEDGRLRHTDTEEVYEYKTACLESRLQRLSALSRLFATADKEIANNAASAAHALDPVGGCFDLGQMARVGKVSAQDKAADDALKLAVAEARALFDAGKYAAGVRRLEEALAAGGPPRTRAEAQLWLGRLRVRAGDGKKAGADFLAASAAALEAQDAALEAMAFSRLGGTTGFDQEASGADAWLGLARAAGTRVRDDWEVQAELATNEALVAMARKQFKEALAGFQAVLALQEEHLGPTSSAVAMTLNNLGVANSNLGLFAEAIARYERSLAVHRAQEGDDHPNTASAENNLAFVLRRLGRYGDAATHYRRVLEVRKKALGPTHPETLKTAEALAMVSIATGNSELALDLLEETLAAHQKAAGPESREVANLYDDLSELYARGQYWKEAARYADLELEVARKVAGDRSLLTARGLLAQGEVHTHLGDWAAAAKALDDCLSIRLEKSGADSHEVAVALNAQGDLALAQRHPAEALALYARARDTRTRAGPATPEALAGDLLRTGRALVQVDRAVEAVAPLREARRLRQAVEDPTGLATVEFELGRALWLANEAHRDEARPLLLASVTTLPPVERREAEAWLAQQPVAAPDAGTP